MHLHRERFKQNTRTADAYLSGLAELALFGYRRRTRLHKTTSASCLPPSSCSEPLHQLAPLCLTRGLRDRPTGREPLSFCRSGASARARAAAEYSLLTSTNSLYRVRARQQSRVALLRGQTVARHIAQCCRGSERARRLPLRRCCVSARSLEPRTSTACVLSAAPAAASEQSALRRSSRCARICIAVRTRCDCSDWKAHKALIL